MRAESGVLVFGLLFGLVSAHDWGWGNCPTIPPVKNFSVSKFLGLWYVIELFDSSSTCQTLNYTRVSETQLTVTKGRQLYLLDTLNIDHTNSYTGRLDIPDGDNAASMRVKWPLNIAGKADYTIFDTDYDTYGAIFECQQISTLAHRQSATILSRNPTLDATFVDRVKRLMTTHGIQTSHFDKIDHSTCTQRNDADLKIDIDDSTFKNIMNSATDGIKNVATQVANGASNVADAVVGITRRFGASTDDTSGSVVNAEISQDPDVEIIS
ncbi:hypothetical protein SK128_011938 [Halocaridina rubra]|uniref:Lipocalin/cytosolic fatty-acid binding domain-containing protein n=1 Tax=Halocaridina rubra TaxID=373956 RepID=A0AAN9FTS4_HALRR